MPVISPLMPIPQHLSISVTQIFLAMSAGVANSGTYTIGHAPSLSQKILVTELVKCDLFVAANLVTDKTRSSQIFISCSP